MKHHDATVLIPTYNRPEHLARLIRYIAAVFDQARIRFIVLDGSDLPNEANRDLCARYNVGYHYYGTTVSVLERVLDGLQRVETDIVSFLADDDLIYPHGYFRCVDFLKNNPDYTVAHGDYASFSFVNGKIRIWESYQNWPMEQDHPLDRLYCLLSHYEAIFYAVHRTVVLRQAFAEVLANVEEKDLIFMELLPACIEVILGKVMVFREFYYGRNVGISLPRKVIAAAKLVFVPDFSDRYLRMKQSIAKFLPGDIDLQTADDAIDLCFANYFAQCMTIRGIDSRYRELRLTPTEWRDDILSRRWVLGSVTGLIRKTHHYFIKTKMALKLAGRSEVANTLKLYYSDG